jgi:hypothetical protein
MRKFITQNIKIINRVIFILLILIAIFLLLIVIFPSINEIINFNLIKDVSLVVTLTISFSLSLTINITYNSTKYIANRDIVLNQKNEIANSSKNDEKKQLLKIIFQIKESISEIVKVLNDFKKAADFTPNINRETDLKMSRGFYMEIFEPFNSVTEKYRILRENLEVIEDENFVSSLNDLLTLIEVVEKYVTRYFFPYNKKELVDSIKQSQAKIHYDNVNSFLEKFNDEYNKVIPPLKKAMNEQGTA